MAWENALDRLVLRQIHAAEKGDVRVDDVQREIVDLVELAPTRAESAFHLGYARALLGVDLPSPPPDPDHQRWYTFGRLRGHDRRGERNWVADLISEQAAIMELLREPRIAAQCLPVAMRTLFWCGNLDVAVRALAYLTSIDEGEHETLVDAALVDLLTRLERREDRAEEETTQSILHKVMELDCFERLPADTRAGYHRALGQRMLAASEFDEALAIFEQAHRVAPGGSHLRSNIALGSALALMRLHDVTELAPAAERDAREGALEWLAVVEGDDQYSVPEAVFAKAVLMYEQGEFQQSAELFDRCTKRFRRCHGRDSELIGKTRFFLAAALLASENPAETSRALRLMDAALETVRPDLESFYEVHEALKGKDRRLALRFLDAVDVGRGTAPDQLLFVALEYLGLGEAEPASAAANRVLELAVDLDQRVEAMRVLLTAHNMRGDRNLAREVYQDIRELLMQRGRFEELEKLLKTEDFVGQALDHLEIKCELVALYEEMENRDFEKASLQTAIARSLRARKDAESMRQALGILEEVEIAFPDLAREDIEALQKLLELSDAASGGAGGDREDRAAARAAAALGRNPRVLVVGGNERQRRHHPRFLSLADDWGFDAEWLMANYSSPQRLVATIGERLQAGIDVLVLLHWNRHETTEPALDLARRHGVLARTVHYAGFTSLQVCLDDLLEKLVAQLAAESGGKGAAKGARPKARS